MKVNKNSKKPSAGDIFPIRKCIACGLQFDAAGDRFDDPAADELADPQTAAAVPPAPGEDAGGEPAQTIPEPAAAEPEALTFAAAQKLPCPIAKYTGKTLAKQLLAGGFPLSGVPGFYRDDAGQWTFISEQRGILIPVRDVQGRIQGLQIRRDNVQKRKFRWVSSTGRQDGCRAEGWRPVREKIILIEGPLKADVKADVVYNLTGQSVLAVPGVKALLQLEQTLSLLRESGVRKIATALDLDFLRNWYVQNGYGELTGLLAKMGFPYTTLLWNPDYNGLDDYVWACCLNRGKPNNP